MRAKGEGSSQKREWINELLKIRQRFATACGRFKNFSRLKVAEKERDAQFEMKKSDLYDDLNSLLEDNHRYSLERENESLCFALPRSTRSP